MKEASSIVIVASKNIERCTTRMDWVFILEYDAFKSRIVLIMTHEYPVFFIFCLLNGVSSLSVYDQIVMIRHALF